MVAVASQISIIDFIDQVREREADGRGIGTALPYFLASECSIDGSENEPWIAAGCSKGQWKRWRKEAAGRFVYRDDDMTVKAGVSKELRMFGKATREDAGTLTAGACMDFENIFSSKRRDRDGDILEPSGADLDPSMPLLLHHNPALPVGKLVKIVKRDVNQILTHYSIFDNALGNDTAGLVEFGSYRFSHGFQPKVYVPLDGEGEDEGWHVKEYYSMEGSLVTIPSNIDAIVTQSSRKKFASPYFKSWGKKLYEMRKKIVGTGYNPLLGRKGSDDDAEKSMSGAYAEGREAARNGQSLIHNPHPQGTPERLGWEQGWNAQTYGKAADAKWRKGSDDDEPKTDPNAWQNGYKEGYADGTAKKPGNKKFESMSLEWQQGYRYGYEMAQEDAKGTEAVEKADDLRWNKTLSKAFDVANAEFEPASVIYKWVSEYLEVPVKEIHESGFDVPSAKIGSFLSGWRDAMANTKVEDVRALDYSGRESPPNYEKIRLNSTKSDDFLVDGVVFYRSSASLVVSFQRAYFGMAVRMYGRLSDSKETNAKVEKAWSFATERYNFLKGEAFSLSGEFITKTEEGFDDVFLEPGNKVTMKRLSKNINTKGASLENRGVIACGEPGTGKTLTGRCLLNNTNATFIWVSARDFHYSGGFGGMAYGFSLARELAPSILFIEDVDNWLDDYTVDMIKTEMDGIRQYKGVTTILTTNFPERLPEALIDRPGRFHDVLKFGLPDDDCRKQMLMRWIPELTAKRAVPPDEVKVGDVVVSGNGEERTVVDVSWKNGMTTIKFNDGSVQRFNDYSTVNIKATEEHLVKAVAATKGMSGAHIKELSKFAKSIQQDEDCTVPESVEKALAKIKEQRELIDKVQLQGSNYRPRRDHEVIIKGKQRMSFISKAAKDGLLKIKADADPEEKPKEDEKTSGNMICNDCVESYNGGKTCPKCGGTNTSDSTGDEWKGKDGEVDPNAEPDGDELPPVPEETAVTVPMLKDILGALDSMDLADAPEEAKGRHGTIKNMLKGCYGKMKDWAKSVKDMANGHDLAGVIESSMKSAGEVHSVCSAVGEELERLNKIEALPDALRGKGEEMMGHVTMVRDALGAYATTDVDVDGEMKDVEDPCPGCNGSGKDSYTGEVCSVCGGVTKEGGDEDTEEKAADNWNHQIDSDGGGYTVTNTYGTVGTFATMEEAQRVMQESISTLSHEEGLSKESDDEETETKTMTPTVGQYVWVMNNGAYVTVGEVVAVNGGKVTIRQDNGATVEYPVVGDYTFEASSDKAAKTEEPDEEKGVWEECDNCDGTGLVDTAGGEQSKCSVCGGVGEILKSEDDVEEKDNEDNVEPLETDQDGVPDDPNEDAGNGDAKSSSGVPITGSRTGICMDCDYKYDAEKFSGRECPKCGSSNIATSPTQPGDKASDDDEDTEEKGDGDQADKLVRAYHAGIITLDELNAKLEALGLPPYDGSKEGEAEDEADADPESEKSADVLAERVATLMELGFEIDTDMLMRMKRAVDSGLDEALDQVVQELMAS